MPSLNLADMFIGMASRYAAREAISTHETSLTFEELLREAYQGSRYLKRRGIAAGDRVAIALPKPEQTISALLGLWMLGATGMVVDFRIRRPEKNLIAGSFGFRAIIETTAAGDAPAYEPITVKENWSSEIDGEDAGLVIPAPATHPAMIIRTSGTTGTPQGIVYNHDTLLNLHWGMGLTSLGVDHGLLIHALPMFYASPLVRTISQLLDGSPTHVLPFIASAEELAETCIALRARALTVVPPQLIGLLKISAGRTSPLFPDLKMMNCTGAAISAENSMRAHRELTSGYSVSYGSTVGGALALLAGDDVLTKPGTVGRPFPFNHFQIVDGDDKPVKTGETGLIKVRTPFMADAILGEERAHSDRLVDGWAIPGDLGFLDEDGFLTLTGRASNMIIRKGVNVFPREVESIFERHPDIVEVAVVGYPSTPSGEEIAAFVVARAALRPEDVVAYARSNIVPDKRPRMIQIVPSLPRNDSGKIDRRKLVEQCKALET